MRRLQKQQTSRRPRPRRLKRAIRGAQLAGRRRRRRLLGRQLGLGRGEKVVRMIMTMMMLSLLSVRGMQGWRRGLLLNPFLLLRQRREGGGQGHGHGAFGNSWSNWQWGHLVLCTCATRIIKCATSVQGRCEVGEVMVIEVEVEVMEVGPRTRCPFRDTRDEMSWEQNQMPWERGQNL